jgi:hypothetical protein
MRPKGLFLSLNKAQCVEVPSFTQRAISQNFLLSRRSLFSPGDGVPTLSHITLRNSLLPGRGLCLLYFFEDVLSLDHNPHSGIHQKHNGALHPYGFCFSPALLLLASEQILQETCIVGIMLCSPLHLIGQRPDNLHRPLYTPATQALPDVGLLSDWGWWNPKIAYLQQLSHSWIAQIARRSRGDCFPFLENPQKLPGQIQYLAQVSLLSLGKSVLSGPYVQHIMFSNLYSIYVIFRILTNKTFPTSYSRIVNWSSTVRKLADLHVVQRSNVRTSLDSGPSLRESISASRFQLLLIHKVVFILTGSGLMAFADIQKDAWPLLHLKFNKLPCRRYEALPHIDDIVTIAELHVIQRNTVLLPWDSGPPSYTTTAITLWDYDTHHFPQRNLGRTRRRKDGGPTRSHLHGTVKSMENQLLGLPKMASLLFYIPRDCRAVRYIKTHSDVLEWLAGPNTITILIGRRFPAPSGT